MSRHVVPYLILGAGPTALGAAYRLRELGEPGFLLLEAAGQVGGLATSFTDERGFTWDVGGHVQFSHYDYFDQLMFRALTPEGWLKHQRESWAWMDGVFVPYPVQNNIRYLPREKAWACLEGIITANLKAAGAAAPRNFREWILSRFGAGFAEAFMFPYNWKVWAHPLEEMDFRWVGERVAVTDVLRVAKNILLELDDVSWGPNNTFLFPKTGGTGAVWNAVADLVGRSQILLHRRVTAVDPAQRIVRCADGSEYGYENLISTIPLDHFVGLLDPVRPRLQHAARDLRFSSSNIVGLGLEGRPPPAVRSKCWMYFPESNCPFYRVTVFSNYSPNNVPDSTRYWSLMTETSESVHKAVDQATLVEQTIQGCLNTHLIERREEIVSIWTYRAEHGYPTPTLGRDAALNTILPELEAERIFSRGRFGGWKYEASNQDHSLMQGVELADYLKLGTPEFTFRQPEVLNSQKRRSR